MDDFVFKSVFCDHDDCFYEQLSDEIVCESVEPASIEDLLSRFGCPCDNDGFYDIEGDSDDFTVSAMNDIDFDIIDAYEEGLRIGSLRNMQESQKSVPKEEIGTEHEATDDEGAPTKEEDAT